MKKIYITISIVLLTSFLMAQQGMEGPRIHHYGAVPVMTKNLTLPSNFGSKDLGDTTGFSTNYVPQVVFANLVGGYGLTATGVGKIGYWWGTNKSPADTATDVWIQCYQTIDASPINVIGIGFYCVNKTIMSGDGTLDSVRFYLQKTKVDGCMTEYTSGTPGVPVYGPGPKGYLNMTGTNGTCVAKARMALADIDTSLSQGLVFNYVTFAAPVSITTSAPVDMFGIACDFFQPRMAGDTVYFVCDDQGDGQAMKFSQQGDRMPNGTGFYYPMSNFFTYNGTDGGLDNNGAIFAVMSPTIGISENFINGMKLGVRNTSDGAILDYAIQSNSKVNFIIHDITGKLVDGYAEGNKTAGQYSLKLNSNRLAPGQYIVIMNACGRSLAKQIIIQ